MVLADASIFFGRFHPLLVHLPIGFLILSAVLALLGRREKYQAIQPAISFALLAGTICAILACITGFILSSGGDYDQETLSTHMLGGFTTAIVSLFAYLLSTKMISIRYLQTGRALFITMAIMVIAISVTGHFGGTLTHGSGYLSSDILFDEEKKNKKITDINNAFIYEDLVEPILEKKCSNCHNGSKKKGQFSVESYKSLMKGGKHGVVIEAGQSGKSELIKRVTLNPADEKFMPGDNKPSLTENEKNIIIWWIDKAGAAVGKIVKEAGPTDAVKKDIVAFLGLPNSDPSQQGDEDSSSNYLVHLNLPNVAEQQVKALKQSGFVVKYINLKPVLLDVTLPEKNAGPDMIDGKLKLLLSVKDNIFWLNIAGNNISDGQLQTISLLRNLQRLRLDNNPVTDAGVVKLKTLLNLESINLYNTKVTNESLVALSSLTKLKHVYVWGTNVSREGDSLKIVTGVNKNLTTE